jgi:nitrite reductase/ring-hydroxylating ferredoxin subunit
LSLPTLFRLNEQKQMPDWVPIVEESAIAAGSGAKFFVDDIEVAVFRSDGDLYAIEGRCPHKGASLGNGTLENGQVTCPWHDWKFDLKTGAGLTSPSSAVASLAVRVNDGSIEIDRETLPQKTSLAANVDDGIHRYLVRYGSLGWVAVFGNVDKVECQHRDRVILQTHRGQELGEILSTPEELATQNNSDKPGGEVVRLAELDEVKAHGPRSRELTTQLIEDCSTVLAESDIDLAIVDGEVLFDGESAVLYFLGDSNPDAGPLVTDIAKRHGLERIELYPFIDPPEPAGGGCGKEGCGGGGCHS